MGDTDMPTSGDLSRRSVIKRAAVVGAATAWATPTIQSIASPAFATGSPQGGCTARMTGGGRLDTLYDDEGNPIPGSEVKFQGVVNQFMTFGLGNITCTPPGVPDYTQIQVNAHPQGKQKEDASYHFTIATITCTKQEPNPAPGPRTTECANVFTGTAKDEFGNTLSFRLADHGEGGNMDLDMAYFSINGGAVLVANRNLNKGNLQVHANVPQVSRDCSGC